MLPSFGEDGNLPPGRHECSWEEFTEHFGFTPHRAGLCETLLRMLQRAKLCEFIAAIVMGSFISTKAEPKDFDVMWLLRSGLETSALDDECRQLLDGNRAPQLFGCDVFSCPEDSAMLDYLTGVDGFGIDKVTKNARGLVILRLADL